MITNDQLLNLIPFHKDSSGREIAPNNRLREITRLLKTYEFDQKDLFMMKQEIWSELPQWRKKQLIKTGQEI